MLRLGAYRQVQYICRCACIRSRSTTTSGVDPVPDSRAEHEAPSGWTSPKTVPAPPGVKPAIPFHVRRSHNRNLPVYTDYKSGRSQILTMIKNIDGDVLAMERELRKFLDIKGLRSRADSLIGRIVLHGNHRDKVKQWLKLLGF